MNTGSPVSAVAPQGHEGPQGRRVSPDPFPPHVPTIGEALGVVDPSTLRAEIKALDAKADRLRDRAQELAEAVNQAFEHNDRLVATITGIQQALTLGRTPEAWAIIEDLVARYSD